MSFDAPRFNNNEPVYRCAECGDIVDEYEAASDRGELFCDSCANERRGCDFMGAEFN